MDLIATRSFFIVCVGLMLLGCQSGSSDGNGETATARPVDAPIPQTETPPEPSQLIDPPEPLKTRVRLVNPDGSTSASDGWSVVGACGNGDTSYESGGGKRHFLTLAGGCELTQLTESALENRHAASLQFALSADKAFAEQGAESTLSLEVELFAENSTGQTSIVRSSRVTVDSSSFDWQRKQILVDYSPISIDEPTSIGVRFRAVSENSHAIYLSDVQLDLFGRSEVAESGFNDNWSSVCDQAWVGASYWANRIHDWHVHNGRLETRNGNSKRPMRTAHRLTTLMSAAPESFELSVSTGAVGSQGHGAFSGILLGAGSGLDYRAAALIHNRSGRNGGLIVGVDSDGRGFVRDNGISVQELGKDYPPRQPAGNPESRRSVNGYQLRVSGNLLPSTDYELTVNVFDSHGNSRSSTTAVLPAERLLGNIALVSHPGSTSTEHWFNEFQGSGGKLKEINGRAFGPVLMATYTLSRGQLNLNAQFPQLCADQYGIPTLSIKLDTEWREVARSDIDSAAFVARFTVDGFSAEETVRYRVELPGVRANQTHYFYGSIQQEPVNRDDFIISTLNCRPGVILSDTEGWIQQNNGLPFSWTEERLVYPHSELLGNAAKHQSDLLAFLGDQIYEFDPNGLIDKNNLTVLIDDYFWKWQQFVFSVREYTRHTPAFIIPDDHDVFQGNLWGAGGVPANAEADGGFVYPSEFVQIVQKTQTGSLPRSSDASPVAQGIDVYFTDLVYGGVGIAVLEDRKFKSPPHIADDDAILLGERQLAFLDGWARDWDQQSLKLVVSQSPLAQSTTHSGADATRIKWDRDSNGWPKSGRDRAVAAMRRAFAPHLNGDQHLGISLQHGIETHNDAVHSFAGPAMLNIFPRIWDPGNEGAGPGNKSHDYRGQFMDLQGNLIEVFAAANPETYYKGGKANGSVQKNELGIGYGVVRLNKSARTYTFEAWPASVDPDRSDAAPYEHWPIKINQTDNDGRIPVGYLSPRFAAVGEPVVKVFNEQTGELVYARRYPTSEVVLPVYDAGTTYTVELSDEASGYRAEFLSQQVTP